MLRPTLAALALLLACGPGDPPIDDDTGATDGNTTDDIPTGSVPTGDASDTDEPSTDGAELCGACESLATGDLSPSGDTRIDGMIVAAGQLRDAVLTIRGGFGADVRALGDLYGVAVDDAMPTDVAALIAAIQADFAANLAGGVQVRFIPPTCHASVEVAALAQRACEAHGGCDVVDPIPDELPAACEGLCDGACTGSCSGEFSCRVVAPGVACDGLCDGTCELAGGDCDGTCRGQCAGNCERLDGMGQCAGRCDGACDGLCELARPAACPGPCAGTCLTEQGSPQCSSEATCHGLCDSECVGRCAGRVTPPSLSADCESSPDCNTQAQLHGDASLRCEPPILAFEYTFALGVDGSARAAFLARTALLERHGRRVIQDAARLTALIDGSVDGQVLWSPSPLGFTVAVLQGLIDVGVSGDLVLPAGRLPCVLPALQEAVQELAQIGATIGGTLEAQAQLVAFLTDAT